MDPIGLHRAAWINGLGNDWLKRNRDQMRQSSEALTAMEKLNIVPKNVLEIGCANGEQLIKIKNKFNCSVLGIDPSPDGVMETIRSGAQAIVATADRIPADNHQFDVVIFGFCLCFIAPEDWINVVAESNRVLADGGYLIICDFIGCRYGKQKFMQVKINDEPALIHIFVYDWASLWIINPGYQLIYDNHIWDKAEITVVLKKDFGRLLESVT